MSSARAEVVQCLVEVVGGRKIEVSVRMPVSPGSQRLEGILAHPRSPPRVGAGELLDDEHEPGAALDDGVPDQRLVVDRDRRDVREAQPAAGPGDRAPRPSASGSAIFSIRCRTCSRCCGVSMKPPVPGVEASRKRQRRDHLGVAGRLRTTWPRVTPLPPQPCSGSTCTWSCWSRMPQTETLATPGTPISLGRTIHWAITDCSMADSSSDDKPDHQDAVRRGQRLEQRRAASTRSGSACAWVSRSSMS